MNNPVEDYIEDWTDPDLVAGEGWEEHPEVRAGGPMPLAKGCSYEWCKQIPKEIIDSTLFKELNVDNQSLNICRVSQNER